MRADIAMLSDWLQRPHWREWWGEPDTELGYIEAMIDGTDQTCEPFIFYLDAEPFGYIQCWQIGPHQTPEWTRDNPWLSELAPYAVGVDLSIASESNVSKGIGSTALRAFAVELVRRGHGTIIIDPDPANVRAVRAYAKAGFRPVPYLEGRTEDVLIMQFQLDSNPS